MKALREAIPSMFHRRLVLLLVCIGLAAGVLAVQVVNLTVVQGAQRREQAERVLSLRRLVPTVRGQILDRKGRVLAEDVPGSDIDVDYEVITGQWAYRQARADAYRDNKNRWAQMSFDDREALIATYRGPYDEQLDRLWRTLVDLGGLSSEELERRKTVVINRVQMIRSDVWSRAVDRRQQETGGPVELSEVATAIAEERDAHTLLPAVADQLAFEFRKLGDELPGLSVRVSRARRYPYQRFEVELRRDSLPSPMQSDEVVGVPVENVGGHLLGSMREVWAQDVERRPFYRAGRNPDMGGYLPGDDTGLGGIEAASEDRLRGLRGQVLQRRDTDQTIRTPITPGRDAHASIDIMLQARIRAMMDPSFGLMTVQSWHNNTDTPVGTKLNGAVVVMEVDTGELLAMVSTPAPPVRELGKPYPDLTRDPDQPLFNRAVAAVYPPGSTIKPLVYAMAASTNAIQWDQPIACDGHFLPGRKDLMRCWIYRAQYGYQTHGTLAPAEAIARSCNIYFYTCGDRMGPQRLSEQMRRWGFGEPTGIGLPDEVGGMLPGPDADWGRLHSEHSDAMIGIGQGPIAVPPIQVAAAHAALARGGYYLSPLLIRERSEQQKSHELDIPPRVIDNALRGMYESANESYGTGHHLTLETGREPIINLDRVTVRAKTGTAQAPVQFEDFNANGVRDPDEPIIRDGTHSWYIAHVQKPGEQRAAYVVVVMVEYGGSGGRVSGPVCNQVLHALRAEGYL